MTVSLASGGTITVLENGMVEFRDKGRTFRTEGKGSQELTAEWIQGIAYGTDVRYVKR
jgi:hypothetical protein